MDRVDIQPGKFCAESLRQGIRLEIEDTIHAQSVATEVFGEKSIRVNDGKPSAGIASSHANQIVSQVPTNGSRADQENLLSPQRLLAIP